MQSVTLVANFKQRPARRVSRRLAFAPRQEHTAIQQFKPLRQPLIGRHFSTACALSRIRFLKPVLETSSPMKLAVVQFAPKVRQPSHQSALQHTDENEDREGTGQHPNGREAMFKVVHINAFRLPEQRIK